VESGQPYPPQNKFNVIAGDIKVVFGMVLLYYLNSMIFMPAFPSLNVNVAYDINMYSWTDRMKEKANGHYGDRNAQ